MCGSLELSPQHRADFLAQSGRAPPTAPRTCRHCGSSVVSINADGPKDGFAKALGALQEDREGPRIAAAEAKIVAVLGGLRPREREVFG